MRDAVAIHDAYKRGDLEALRTLLGDPHGFPNCADPSDAESILQYAIYHSPLCFVRTLLELGADPNYDDRSGFPSLIAALSCQDRPDMHALIELLLSFGASTAQRGHNDYTALHYAANLQDERAMAMLIAHGADLNARTRIDQYATPLEEAEILGRDRSIAFLKQALGRKP
jgi:ankyrin repeat protein